MVTMSITSIIIMVIVITKMIIIVMTSLNRILVNLTLGFNKLFSHVSFLGT